MSGHSKWAQIKRQKAVADKKKGQLFSKVVREITVAARAGTDPETNYRLRLTIERAKDAGMPKENIEKAIERGSGKGGGAALEEITYEGFGPFGTTFLIEVATDNKNRIGSKLKQIFVKHGGKLGGSGSVAWQFVTRGQILVERSSSDMSDLELAAIDAGAEDVRKSQEGLEIYTLPLDLNAIKAVLLQAGAKIAQSAIIKESSQGRDLGAEEKTKIETLLSDLEAEDDVIAVHTNANL